MPIRGDRMNKQLSGRRFDDKILNIQLNEQIILCCDGNFSTSASHGVNKLHVRRSISIIRPIDNPIDM